MNSQIIERRLALLPEQLQKEALDFIDFLIQKKKFRKKESREEFEFDWEGGLSLHRKEYSSVELQHASAGWR